MTTQVRMVATVIICGLVMAVAVLAQDKARWMRPYTEAPGYWERITPSFPASMRPLVGPHVDAAVAVNDEVMAGDRVVLLVTFNTLLEASTGRAIRMTFGGAQEARFVGADTAGVTIATRDESSSLDTPTRAFFTCLDEHQQSLGYRVDARWQVVQSCLDTGFKWNEWTTLRFPFSGVIRLERDLTLAFSYDAIGGVLRTTVVE